MLWRCSWPWCLTPSPAWGFPACSGLAIDWTFFDTTLPSGRRIRYQVLRIAVPRKGRALPLLQLAYDRENLSPNKSQNQIEQEAILAVVRALPEGVRPCDPCRQGLPSGKLHRLAGASAPPLRGAYQEGKLHNRKRRAPLETGRGGAQDRELRFRGRGSLRSLPRSGRRRELLTNVALCWRVSKSRAKDPRRKQPEEPWYLATSLKGAKMAAAWYWQRGWIEQSFKDSKSRFGLARVRVGSPERLSRLLMALSVALTWLSLMGLPESGLLPEGFRAAVSAWGRVSVTGMALSLLEKLENIPLCCLPRTSTDG